ncbi:AraC family transcriptional regulator [Actinoplanes sp. NPDC048796]|uniref:AraC family transcriptional regulator n=1 Tax=unclassified Actinoplanes TaxID=2626549 RepID=UPI0033ECEF26
MDAISKLLRMARLECAVDVRCQLAGAHVLDNPAGDVPFHLLLAGRCTVEIEGRTVDLRAGDVLVLPRGSRHRVRAVAAEPPVPAELHRDGPVDTLRGPGPPDIDLFCGHFRYEPGPGQLLFAGLPDVVHASLGLGSGSPLEPLGRLIRDEADGDGPGAGAMIASLCEALLALVLRRAGGDLPPWTAVTDPGLRRVVDAVVSDPRRPWTIDGLARVAGVSRATLVRHFSAATGLGVADFVTRTRMTIAADLLTGTDRTLDDIAAAVGYRSASAFGKAFRTTTGSTPSALRRAHEKPIRR